MSADAKLKSYIDRILRCREAEDLAKDDTKAVYAELAGDGYEKSVVGQVVTFLRKREKDGDKLSEQSAKFDLYLDAYERPSHVHTRASTLNHGETNERDSQQHVGRTDDEQHHEAPVPGSDGRGEGADAGAEGQGAGASGSDRAGGAVAGTVDREDEDGRSRHVGGEARHEITPSAASHGANAGGDDVDDTIKAAAKAGAPSNCGAPARSSIRPHCQRPGQNCAGYGSKHCHPCEVAAKREEAA